MSPYHSTRGSLLICSLCLSAIISEVLVTMSQGIKTLQCKVSTIHSLSVIVKLLSVLRLNRLSQLVAFPGSAGHSSQLGFLYELFLETGISPDFPSPLGPFSSLCDFCLEFDFSPDDLSC